MLAPFRAPNLRRGRAVRRRSTTGSRSDPNPRCHSSDQKASFNRQTLLSRLMACASIFFSGSGWFCWLHLDLVAIAADVSSFNLGVLTRQRQMNLELYSVAWSRWLPSVHSMFDFAFPVEPRTFPSVPMSVLSCTRALTRLLFFPWTRPSLSTHISGLFESFELGIEIAETTGLRLQNCRLAREERFGNESSGPRKKTPKTVLMS